MTETDGMKNYGANLTNARANAGAIVLYQHEELSLMKAVEGLQALRSARKAFFMVNPEVMDIGTPYDEGEITDMISKVERHLLLCRQRIQSMKESFNQFTGMTWMEKRDGGLVNGTILLTKED
jgi:hypothetical protein